MKQLIICLGIFLSLALSRFIPHPPNFTSLIALSFHACYIWSRFIPIVILSFIITDLVIGYHSGTHWTGKCSTYRTFIKIFCKKFSHKNK